MSGSGTGSVDPDWNPAPNNDVNALAWAAAGIFMWVGRFTQMGGLSRNRIARVSGSGTGAVDANWNPSASGNVLALAMAADGSLYAGGVFTQIGGQGAQTFASPNCRAWAREMPIRTGIHRQAASWRHWLLAPMVVGLCRWKAPPKSRQ
ncbi:MAG: hypothetical protein R3F10_01115 [Lysobacteraceae bacterium]